MADPPLDPVVLEGDLVRLEPLAAGHIPGLTAAAAEDRAAYTYGFVPDGPEACTRFVAEAEAAWRAGGTLAFATVRRADAAVVGSTRFAFAETWDWPQRPAGDTSTPDAVEIGYTWLAASALRSGINVEAKLLQLTHAFDTWHVARVRLRTDRRNRRSWQAIEALGARHDGVMRGDRTGADGTLRDSAYFSILADEWPAVRAGLLTRLDRAVR